MQADRASYQSLLSHHATIVDILEVPQLIDTCVRNNSYDEALDLLAFVSKLCVVAGGATVVQQLASESAAARDGLQRQLLGRLSHDISLPECLTSVSYLRRLGTFSEADLRVQFLKHREQWCAVTRSPRAAEGVRKAAQGRAAASHTGADSRTPTAVSFHTGTRTTAWLHACHSPLTPSHTSHLGSPSATWGCLTCATSAS